MKGTAEVSIIPKSVVQLTEVAGSQGPSYRIEVSDRSKIERAIIEKEAPAAAASAAPYVPGVSSATPGRPAGPEAGSRVATDESAQYSRAVAFNVGGTVELPYPNGSQQSTLVRGVELGMGSFGPFSIDNPAKGIGRIALAEFEGGEIVVDLSISNDAGDTLYEQKAMNSPGTSFTVGGARDGYGPDLPAGVPLYLNVRFLSGTTATAALLQMQAHDRPGAQA